MDGLFLCRTFFSHKHFFPFTVQYFSYFLFLSTHLLPQELLCLVPVGVLTIPTKHKQKSTYSLHFQVFESNWKAKLM